MKKLTRRQKILLSFTLLTLLIGVGAIVFLISGKSGSVNNSHFSQKTQNLSQLRQQQISQIETDLKTKNFLDSNLLQELKSNYGLNATETD
jgi:hypothetical protein